MNQFFVALGVNCLHSGDSIHSIQSKRDIATAVASNRPTEALASVISFTFVAYSHYKHS